MTIRSLLVTGIAIMGMGAAAIADSASKPASPAAAPRTSNTRNEAAADLSAIQQAQTPNAVMDAYTRADEAGRGNESGTLHAYVHRMVSFGMPEFAGTQAAQLIALDSQDGLAWAVEAQIRARQGEYLEALADAVTAYRRAPGDSFVQRTAGSLTAWYDAANPDESAIPESLNLWVEKMRIDIGRKTAFVTAYRAGRFMYQPPAAPAPAADNAQTSAAPNVARLASPPNGAPVNMAPGDYPIYPPSVLSYNRYNTRAYYTYPVYYYPGFLGPSAFYSWWPTGTNQVIAPSQADFIFHFGQQQRSP